jgi:hypothetical protein
MRSARVRGITVRLKADTTYENYVRKRAVCDRDGAAPPGLNDNSYPQKIGRGSTRHATSGITSIVGQSSSTTSYFDSGKYARATGTPNGATDHATGRHQIADE